MFHIKNNCSKVVLFFILSVFLFLTLGAQFLHNHSDSDFHDDCPACKWLIISVFVFTILLILYGLVRNSKAFFNFEPSFILKSYIISQYLRAPPIA